MNDSSQILQRFTNLLVRQEQQLPGDFPIAPKDSGSKSIAEIFGSKKYRDHFSWSKKEDEYGKEK